MEKKGNQEIKHCNIDEDNKSCMDVKNEEGEVIGAVCIATGKDFGKKDIIYMQKQNNAYSVRSVTELLNKVAKNGVPFEERKSILDFASERLRALESNEISSGFKLGSLSANLNRKSTVDKKNLDI